LVCKLSNEYIPLPTARFNRDGCWTYKNFYAYWPNQTDNPFTEVLNNTQ